MADDDRVEPGVAGGGSPLDVVGDPLARVGLRCVVLAYQQAEPDFWHLRLQCHLGYFIKSTKMSTMPKSGRLPGAARYLAQLDI